jgi:hypothetical protein
MALRYHVERQIEASPERVWALLSDASTYRAWNRAVVSIEGTIATGNTISLVSTANPAGRISKTTKANDAHAPSGARRRRAQRAPGGMARRSIAS